MKLVILFSMLVPAALLSAPDLLAQNSQFSSMRSLLRSSTAATSQSYSLSTFVMVENRARTLGTEISGSGTRYFAATDFDLIGKSPEQALQRLSPPSISADDGVRKLETLIDLSHPFTLATRPGQPPDIGTAVVHAAGLKQI